MVPPMRLVVCALIFRYCNTLIRTLRGMAGKLNPQRYVLCIIILFVCVCLLAYRICSCVFVCCVWQCRYIDTETNLYLCQLI